MSRVAVAQGFHSEIEGSTGSELVWRQQLFRSERELRIKGVARKHRPAGLRLPQAHAMP